MPVRKYGNGQGGGPAKKSKTTYGAAAREAFQRDIARGRFAQYVPISRGAVEKKGVDTDIDVAAGSVLATTNTNGAIIVLNLVAPGTGSWNRIGKRIRMQSVRVKGLAVHRYERLVTTESLVGSTLRMVIVHDNNPNSGSIPTFDTIFGRTSDQGTETSEFLDNLRFDNTGRFRVLKDTVIVSNVNAAGIADGALVENKCPFDEYIRLGGMETIFSGQTADPTIADISTGALYVVFRASENDGSGSTTQWAIENATSRLRYYD